MARKRVVAVAAMLVLTAACGGGETVSSSPTEPAGATDVGGWLWGTKVRHERFRPEDGTLEAVFSADEMVLDEDGNFTMHNASLEMSTPDGRTVLARGARIRADSQGLEDVWLDGGVEVNIDDVRVKTDTAAWCASSGLLEGAGPVTVEGNDMSLQCGRFVVDIETRALGVYDISGHINLIDRSTIPGGEEG